MQENPGAGARPLRGIGPRESLRAGMVWPSRRDPSGVNGPTRNEIRGGRWRQTSYGLYVPSSVERSVDQRIVEAAAVHRAGVITGWAALRWMRSRWFDEVGPVPVGVEMRESPSHQSGLVRTTQEFVRHDEILRVDGLRITAPVRSVVYEMRHAPHMARALQVFAMAAYDDRVSIAEVVEHIGQLGPATGIDQARQALPLLTENAWSPMEVSMGVLWRRLRPDATLLFNCPVFGLDGRHLGTPDIIDPAAGVIGEYQGALHLLGSQRAADVVRDERLIASGLEMAIMLAGDAGEPTGFLARLERAYGRAGSRPIRWTLDRPSWWIDTSTVAARRQLDADDARRVLRYRQAS